MADLLGAVRLAESSMHATAGTEVVVDVLVFQRRPEGHTLQGPAWTELREIELEDVAESDLGADEESFAEMQTTRAGPAPTQAPRERATSRPIRVSTPSRAGSGAG
jgi:hypothetical protein